MKKKILFIIIYFFLSVNCSWSQQFYTRNYTINNGLPDNYIRDIYKDSRGFLWIGTDAGLSHFDGKEFSVYTSQEGLAGNKIWSIAETEEGNIWVGCHDGGVSLLNGKNIISYNSDKGLISNEVRKLHYSNKFKLLLVGTEDGLSVLEGKKITSFHEKLNNVGERLQVTHFIETNDFIYVFTNGSGLYKYVPELDSLIKVTSSSTLNNYLITSAYISQMGDTLINYSHNNLLSIRNGIKTTTDFVGYITDYKEDLDNNIWFAAWSKNNSVSGGLFKHDSSGIENYSGFLGINSNNILSLEFDPKENLLWIGTKEKGLFLYPMTNFSYYTAKDFKLPELNVTGLTSDKSGNLWIATKKDIIKKNNSGFRVFHFDKFNGQFEAFVRKTIKLKYSYLIDQNGSFTKYQQLISSGSYPFTNPYKNLNGDILPKESLYKPLKYDILVHKKLVEFNSITIDTKGNTWVGSNVGIFKIDQETEKIRYYDLPGNQFKKFFLDKNNRIYGVNWADLFIYPDIENSSGHYSFNYYKNKSPININAIKSANSKIWFSSSDHGLFLYANGHFYSSYEQKTIDNPSFNTICTDNLGNIIAGGNNGKIYIIEFVNDSIQSKFEISKKNGLLGTSIRYLNCTNNNILVAGTNSGLNLIDLNHIYNTGNIYIETINESKGFIDYSGNTSAIQNNNLWIGSNTELIRTDIEKFEKQKGHYINFFIKAIEVNDEVLNPKTIENTDIWTNIPKSTIKLPYYKNSITFYYDAITYLDPENVHFSYKLEGYHKNWIKKTTDNKAVFQNLKPGKYRLRIKVINTDENLSNQELSVNFIISHPIWLKWWFISIVVISILFIIWLTIYLRTRTIRRRERLRSEIIERVSEYEMKAFRAQMNPHFIFNAINSIQNYMLDNNVDAALEYLSDFAKLIRLTLDNVSKKQITLDEELSYLNYYLKLEQMRFGKKFETEIILPSEHESRKILIPAMIIQPFIENSIKHGFAFKDEGGKIKLEFQIIDDSIMKCIIEDNGIGRKKSKELNKNKTTGKSKGTFITNERISLLNQTQRRKGYKIETIDLFDEYDLPCGTRVEIFIPI